MQKRCMNMGAYGDVATVRESAGELDTLFGEVEEYFDSGVSLSRGAAVVDVGANLGAFAIAAAKRCERDLRLFCFEPVPPLFRALEHNLRANTWLSGGAHCAFNLALSSPEAAGAPCDFYYFRRFPRDSTMDIARKRREFEAFFAAQGARARRALAWAGPLAKVAERAVASLPQGPLGQWASDRVTGIERLQVQVSTLSKALEREGPARIDLLKIDVEGAVLAVLVGIDERTWARVQQVVIETDGAEESARDLVSRATAQGLALVRAFRPPSTAGRGLANVIFYLHRPSPTPTSLYVR